MRQFSLQKSIREVGKTLLSAAVIIILICMGSGKALSQVSPADQASVLQKSIDLAGIQEYYPKDANGNYKRVGLLQFPVSFPENLEVSKFNQPLLFQTRGDIVTNNSEAYLSFKTFSVTGNTAAVEFDYYYNRTSSSVSRVAVTLSLEKTGDTWNIINSTVKNQ